MSSRLWYRPLGADSPTGCHSDIIRTTPDSEAAQWQTGACFSFFFPEFSPIYKVVEIRTHVYSKPLFFCTTLACVYTCVNGCVPADLCAYTYFERCKTFGLGHVPAAVVLFTAFI